MDGLKILNTASVAGLVDRLAGFNLIDDLMKVVVGVARKEISTKYGMTDKDITYIAYSKLKDYNKAELKKKLMLFMLILSSELHAHSVVMVDGLNHNFETSGDAEKDFNTIISRLDKIIDTRNSIRILNLINELESRKEDENKELIIIAEVFQALISYIKQKLKKL